MASQASQVARAAPASVALVVVSAGLTLYTAVTARREPDADEPTLRLGELVLNPANTALTHFYVWNVLSAHVVDVSVIKAALMLVALFQVSVKLESAWGSRGFLVFLGAVGATVGALANLAHLFVFFTLSDRYFFTEYMYGHAGLLAAVLVGNVRVDADDRFYASQRPTRAALLPTLLGYCALAALERATEPLGAHGRWIHDAHFAWLAWLVAFALVRRYDFSGSGGEPLFTLRPWIPDDPFALDAFFPQPLRPLVRGAALVVDAVAARVCTCFARKPGPTLPFLAAGAQPGPWHVPAVDMQQLQQPTQPKNPVAERRRQRALLALDQKLAQMNNEPEIALDGDDVPEDIPAAALQESPDDGDKNSTPAAAFAAPSAVTSAPPAPQTLPPQALSPPAPAAATEAIADADATGTEPAESTLAPR